MAIERKGSSGPSFFVPKNKCNAVLQNVFRCGAHPERLKENCNTRKGGVMNIGKIKHSIAGHVVSVLTVIMIVVMLLFDSLVYRPIQAYAASSVALPWDAGAYASVVSDLFAGMGGTYGKSLNSATVAIEYADYLEERRKEILANPDATQEEIDEALAKIFPFAYKDKAGSVKSVSLSGLEITNALDFVNTLKGTSADTVEIPDYFTKAFQNFLVDKLNFSAVDGSGASAVYTLTPNKYFDMYLHRAGFPIVAKDASFYLTSDATMWIDAHAADAIYFVGPSGSHLYKHYVDGGVSVQDCLDTNSGYDLVRLYGGKAYSFNVSGHTDALVIPGFSREWHTIAESTLIKNRFYIVNYEYVDPSVDVSLADAKVITWTGSADFATTIENQANAESIDEYIAKALTAVQNPDIPDVSESETTGEGTGEGDITLGGILSWLEKLYNGVLALPGNIANAFTAALDALGTKVSAIPEAISAQTEAIGKWISTIPATLADIRDKILIIPDSIGKELTKLGDWVQTIPGALAGIKDQVLAVPKAIASEITAFFAIDTARISNSFDDMTAALKGKLLALNQVIDLFNTDYNFEDTPPVIRMQTPDILKYAVQSDQIVIMDLTQFADIFQWCRTLLAAMMWVAFGRWVIDQFDVKFHVG